MTLVVIGVVLALSHVAILAFTVAATAPEKYDPVEISGGDWDKIDQHLDEMRKRLDGSPTKRADSARSVYDRIDICDRAFTEG